VIWSNGSTFVGSKNMVKEIMSTPGLSVKRLAPVSVEGEFATTFVQFAVPAAGINGPMVDVFQLKDGKIFRMWAFALGVTPPLDNAVMP
jgi:hypothetical protein